MQLQSVYQAFITQNIQKIAPPRSGIAKIGFYLKLRYDEFAFLFTNFLK
jgi:hypothetical protein